MIQPPASDSDPMLDEVIETIVELVHPARIILFGSRARGDATPRSDFDLMVEVDCDDAGMCWSRLADAIRRRNAGVRVDVAVRRPGQLEQRQDDVGYMDWDIARDGVVVYPPGGPLLPIVSSVRRPRRVREAPPPSAHDWLARAADDLRAIETNVGEPPVPWISVCFHSQQAAEKYLKALLVCGHVRPPRTHDLAELVEVARTAGHDLGDVKGECEILGPYSVGARYPEDVPIPDETAGRSVLAAGRRIVAAVQRHVAELEAGGE